MPGVGAEYRGGIKVFRPVLSGYKFLDLRALANGPIKSVPLVS